MPYRLRSLRLSSTNFATVTNKTHPTGHKTLKKKNHILTSFKCSKKSTQSFHPIYGAHWND